jgi:multidrug resistance efflux pump
MTVTQMAGDGTRVEKGAPVVVFDATQVAKDLTTKQGQLDEKRRKQEQLRLDLADRAREAELATAQAKAEMDKAERKANQPKEYIARVDYSKLVIARAKAEYRYALTVQRARVAAAERAAEQHMADAEVAQLDAEVAKLKAALASLTVAAPRDGIVLHQSSFGGGKVDVGSQIWMGQSVAQIPDLSTLAVRAALPERDLDRARLGERVRVVLSGGGGRGLDGRVVEIGSTVHSRSRVDAVPVIDLVVALNGKPAGLKPGQAVQVDIPVSGEAGR